MPHTLMSIARQNVYDITMIVVLQCIHALCNTETLRPYDDCSIAMHSHALYSAAILHEVTNEQKKYLMPPKFTWRLVNKGSWIRYDDTLV